MKIKNLPFYGVLIIVFVVTACGKGGGPLPDPPKADSLGSGWQKISMPDSLYFSDVFFTEDLTGYLCGDKYLAKSINGGVTWNKFNLPDSLNASFYNMYFLNANLGWIVSPSFILKTENGGNSWQKIKLTPASVRVHDIQFVSPMTGFLTSTSGIFKSVDGGLNWTNTSPILEPYGLFFFDSNTGWISYSGHFRKTENGGTDFTITKQLNIVSPQHIVQFTDTQHGWITGANGILWATTDGGNNWEQKGGGGGLGDLHFFNNNTGVVLSGDLLFKTSDAGITWVREAAIEKSDLSEIHFTNENHGWAVGSNGGFYRYIN